MQVNETLNEGLTREFTITIPAADLDAELNSKLVELAPQVNMPGFRPGKVPPALLRQRYGDALLGEVIEKSVNDSSQRALEERDLRPASQPNVEITSYEKGQDLEYKLSVELMPEIDTVDFSTLELERLVAEPGESDISDALARMAEGQKESAPIEDARPAASGDVVVIDFIGKIDGEPFEGGAATDHHLELGSNTFIPGFEDQLVGVEAGTEKAVNVAFPEDYQASHLAGKDAVFEVTLKEIRAPKPVEIDDAFAQRFGLDSLDALKEAVGEQMKGEYLTATRTRMKRQLLDTLADKHSFDVPPKMVEEEYKGIVHQVLQHSGGEEGHDHDHDHDHGHDHGGDPEAGHEVDESKLSEEDRAEYRSIAERRVRLGLLLSEVGRQNNIQVSDEEVSRAIQEQASRFPGQERFVFDYYQQNPQALAQIRAPLFEDKVVDFVVELAKVTDKTVSAEELFRDPDAEDEGEAEAEAAAAEEKKPAKKKAAAKPKASTAKAKPAAKSKKKAADSDAEADAGSADDA